MPAVRQKRLLLLTIDKLQYYTQNELNEGTKGGADMRGIFKKTKFWIVVCIFAGLTAGLLVMASDNIIDPEECYAVTLHYFPYENSILIRDMTPEENADLINLVNSADKKRFDGAAYYNEEIPLKIIYFDRENKSPVEVHCGENSVLEGKSVVLWGDNNYYISEDEELINAINALFAEVFPNVTDERSPEEQSKDDDFVPDPGKDFDMLNYSDEKIISHCWYPGSELADLYWTSENQSGRLLELLKGLSAAYFVPMTEEDLGEYEGMEECIERPRGKDYWVEIQINQRGFDSIEVIHDRQDYNLDIAVTRVIYHLSDGSNWGYKVPDPVIAYELANFAKVDSGDLAAVCCFEQYQICTADKSWEEALELFKENYVDLTRRYEDPAKVWSIENRYRNTYLEHKDSRVGRLEIQEQSDDNKVITFYYEYERTFVNDISSNPGLWSGGGMRHELTADGETKYICGQMGNIVNDGSHWYYVSGNEVGFGPEYLLDENGEIEEGVIDYFVN